MGGVMVYLVNHSRKEFCWFNVRVPVFEELNRIMAANKSWVSSHTIMIQAQDESKGSDLWDHLVYNLTYTDLDYAENMTA
jgi:hypothetical protein